MAEICTAIKNYPETRDHDIHMNGSTTTATNVLNIVCISHWMSHCADGDCSFMRRLQTKLGSTARIDVLVSEERPAFRSAATSAGVASPGPDELEVDRFPDSIADGWVGRRVEEGVRLCKQSRNLYFYTNAGVDSEGGTYIGLSSQPAKRLRKAEREWEQFLFSRNAQQRGRLEALLGSLEAWKAQHADSFPPDSFPSWLLKRIAFVAGRGGSVRDILLGKKLLQGSHHCDSLVGLVEQWCSKESQEPCGDNKQGPMSVRGALSVAFVARWEQLDLWSHVFYVAALGPEGVERGPPPVPSDVIRFFSRKNSSTVTFEISQGPATNRRSVTVKDAVVLGKLHQFLCTVSAGGHMQVFQDGVLVAEKRNGFAPPNVRRNRFGLGHEGPFSSVVEEHCDNTISFAGLKVLGLSHWNDCMHWNDVPWEALGGCSGILKRVPSRISPLDAQSFCVSMKSQGWVERAIEHVRTSGFVVLLGVLGEVAIQEVLGTCQSFASQMETLDPLAWGNRGPRRYSFGAASKTGQLAHLPSFAEHLLDCKPLHEVVAAIYSHQEVVAFGCGGEFVLGRSADFQPLHSDLPRSGDLTSSPQQQSLWPPPQLIANFVLEDQLAENGATRILPGSFGRGKYLWEEEMSRGSLLAPLPRGAVVLRDARTLHSGSPNVRASNRYNPNAVFVHAAYYQSLAPKPKPFVPEGIARNLSTDLQQWLPRAAILSREDVELGLIADFAAARCKIKKWARCEGCGKWRHVRYRKFVCVQLERSCSVPCERCSAPACDGECGCDLGSSSIVGE